MNQVMEIVRKKPLLFLLVSFCYLFVLGLLKWWFTPTIETLWFVLGGVIGIYFLDGAEVFFHLSPSPFRSIVFSAAFVIVSLFVVSSSGSALASGLVLSLFITLILWQVGEWRVRGNINEWYRMVAGPVAANMQRWGIVIFVALFLLETYLFVR
ncbi:hypothetical protein HY948_01415 [Candidatus Gottesmanbacteria bacterium]|nr:hypothetical protein [Candidatus Gottesmanbacteria bacterium]